MPTFVKILISLSVVAGFTLMIVLGIFGYMMAQSPDTFVYTGPQMSKAHVKIARELGLLDAAEEIQYFYSDAFFDIRKGMYFITDERLVLYSEDWEVPLLAVPFEDIVDAEVEYDPSFFTDSTISITLSNGEAWTFPVSSERGRDEDFFEYIETRMSGSSELTVEANEAE